VESRLNPLTPKNERLLLEIVRRNENFTLKNGKKERKVLKIENIHCS